MWRMNVYNKAIKEIAMNDKDNDYKKTFFEV